MFISRLFLWYPREAFCPLIYEDNISMIRWIHQIKDSCNWYPSVLKMAGKFNYVIEGEDSEKYTFLPWGERRKREAFRQLSSRIQRQQLALLHSSIVHADPESQRGRRVAKIGQEKDNNSCFYIRRSFTLIRKVNAIDGLPKKGKKKTTTRAFMFVDRVWKFGLSFI